MISRFFKNKQLVTLIAGGVCVVLLMFFYNYRVNKIIDSIEIPVATRRINAREEITSEDIKMIKVARSLLSDNVITSSQLIEGKYVNYNTFIPEGGLFYDTAIVEWETMPDSTWSNISDGKTIVYLDLLEGNAYGNSIYPGDRIDLYVRTNLDDKLAYGKFIESIKVLAVKDDSGQHIFEKTPNTGTPAQLIFEVDEEMFLLLKSATFMNDNFEIIPVPRNEQYTINDKETLVSSLKLKQQILAKSTMLYPDVVDDAGANNDINIKE